MNQKRKNKKNKSNFMHYYSEKDRSLTLCPSSYDLDEKKIDDQDIKQIMNAQLSISVLWLSINNITQEGAKELAKGKLQNLNEIYLGWNRLLAQGARYLSTASWPKLKKIWIVNNSIGQKGAKYLSNGDWPLLEQLNIGHNHIGNQGSLCLGKAKWKNLTKLWISENFIQSSGVKCLVKANWKNITHFSLWNNLMNIEGFELMALADWKSSQSINLSRNLIYPCNQDPIPRLRQMYDNLYKNEKSFQILNQSGISHNNNMIGLAIDIGTANTKIGFIGQSQPRLLTDSVYLSSESQRTVHQYEQQFFTNQKQERLFGKDINVWRHDVTGQKIFDEQWQHQEKHLKLLNYSIKKQSFLQFIRGLVAEMKELKQKNNQINQEISQYGLLIIEPTYLKKYEINKYRQIVSNFVFEELHLSSIYFMKSSVCTTYSQGRTNSIVVDSGHNFTSISRVVDGYNQKSINLNFAGNIIGYQLEKYLEQKKLIQKMNFFVSKGRCVVFEQLCKAKEVIALKKCFKIENSQDIQQQGSVNLELADKTTIEIGRNEIIQPFTQLQQYKKMDNELYFPEKYYSIARCVVELLQQQNGTHIDTIILTGGNMLFNNLSNKITDQILRLLANRGLEKKIVKSRNPMTSGWVGSSIAGSTNNFPFYWCTISEYRQHGLNIINKKCPL